ncbi:MAG: ABC transporter permease [Verrucomicrobiota bacterium]
MAMPAFLRSFVSRPAYLIVSVLVLGVSIGAQVAIVAVLDAVLLSPPSARAPGELAFVRSSLSGGQMSFPDYKDIAERSTSFSSVASFYTSGRTALTNAGDLVQVRCGVASGSFFPTLQVGAGGGRLFGPEDDVTGAAPVAVITAELSRSRQLEVGSMIQINTAPFTVIGVLPEGFRGIDRVTAADLWIPVAQLTAVSPKWVTTNRGYQSQQVVARLKPDVSIETANAEVAAIAQLIHQENTKVNYGLKLHVQSFAAFRYGLDGSARTMVLLGALVWVLFALAFTNFFALTLVQLLGRRREIAVRVAVGATRAHLGRWLLGELAVVVVLALAVGTGLGAALLRLLTLDPKLSALVDTAGVRIDFGSLGVVAAAVAGCALVVWLLAWRDAGRVEVLTAIKEQATAPRRQAMFNGLFALQIAIALFLVTTAATFVDALSTLANKTYPFRTDNLLLFEVNFRNLGLQETRVAEAEKYLARLRAVPGVEAVGGAMLAPLDGAGGTNVVVRERDPNLEPDKGQARWIVAGDGYFEAAGIRILQGRGFTAQELAGAAKVVVINSALARRYWPNGDALGQSMKQWAGAQPHTIVGIVDDIPADTRSRVAEPQIYTAWGQASPTSLVFHVAVRQDSAALRRAIEASLRDVWPHKTLPALRSGREQLGLVSAELATAVRVVLWLAGFATAVTSCGLYFFSAYTAAQTTRDAAIRQALGATMADLLRAHLMRYALGAAVGVALGFALAWSARPVMAAAGIVLAPMDAVSITIAAAALAAIALAGLCLPLRRLRRLDLARTLSQGG